MKIAAIIPTFNEGPDLELTVASLVASRPVPDYILVYDDCSSDDFCVKDRLQSFKRIRKVEFEGVDESGKSVRKTIQWGGVTLVQSTPKPGYSFGNMGASVAKRKAVDCALDLWSDIEVVVVMDSHVRMPMDWIPDVVEAVKRHPDGIFCTRCQGFDARQVGWHAAGGRFNQINQPWPEVNFWSRKVGRGVTPVPAIIGGFYIFPVNVYRKIGGFNPNFVGYGPDEPDVSIRAHLLGGGCFCIDSLVVAHNFRRDMVGYHLNGHETILNHRFLCATLFDRGIYEKHYEEELKARTAAFPASQFYWETEMKSRISQWRRFVHLEREKSWSTASKEMKFIPGEPTPVE